MGQVGKKMKIENHRRNRLVVGTRSSKGWNCVIRRETETGVAGQAIKGWSADAGGALLSYWHKFHFSPSRVLPNCNCIHTTSRFFTRNVHVCMLTLHATCLGSVFRINRPVDVSFRSLGKLYKNNFLTVRFLRIFFCWRILMFSTLFDTKSWDIVHIVWNYYWIRIDKRYLALRA